MMKRKPFLIAEWRACWRLWSVKVSALGVAASGAWVLLPPEQQAAILGLLHLERPGVVPLVGFIAAIVARVIKQQPPKDEP